jgi:hypothetical protein
MRKFSRITHHLYCIGLRDDLLSLSMHRVITQFHRFLYIFNCRMLVGHLRLKIVSTCLSGRSCECHSWNSAPTRGHKDESGFISLLRNIMSCQFFNI